MDATNSIPIDLYKRLEALKNRLNRDSSVQRDRTGFRVRYRDYDNACGFIVHRSFTIGSDLGVAQAVLLTLGEWKLQRREQETADKQAIANSKMEDSRWDQMRQMIAVIAEGGRDHRRNVLKAFDAAVQKGPFEVFNFMFHLPAMRPTGKPGRKYRGRLW